jgi:hypothetical protein
MGTAERTTATENPRCRRQGFIEGTGPQRIREGGRRRRSNAGAGSAGERRKGAHRCSFTALKADLDATMPKNPIHRRTRPTGGRGGRIGNRLGRRSAGSMPSSNGSHIARQLKPGLKAHGTAKESDLGRGHIAKAAEARRPGATGNRHLRQAQSPETAHRSWGTFWREECGDAGQQRVPHKVRIHLVQLSLSTNTSTLKQ